MSISTVRVGDISTQIRGVTYGKDEAQGGPLAAHVALLRAGNIDGFGINYNDLVYVPQTRVATKQRLRRNDVLVAASSGSLSVVGKAGLIRGDVDATFGAFCKVLRPTAAVHPSYFAHYFRTPQYRAEVTRLAAGANINNLRNDDLNNLEVPLPPLPEQRRIAAILDQADELRARCRRALALLDELADSIFIDMFEMGQISAWPTMLLESVAELQGGLTVNQARVSMPLEVPYLRVANVGRGRIALDHVKTMSVSHTELERVRLNIGDLLIVEGHGNAAEVGRVARWSDARADTVHQNHLIRVRALEARLNPVYLESYMNSSRGRAYFARVAKTTSGLNTINMANVRAVPTLIPPLSIQQTYAERIAHIERCRAIRFGHLAKLDELFASLQHRAFRGEL